MEGIWHVDRTVSREMATVRETQTVVDRSLPPSGSITLSGRETGALSDVVVYTTAVNDYHRLKLTSRALGTTPQPGYELVFIQRTQGGARFQSVELDRFSESGNQSYGVETESAPYLFDIGGASVSVDQTLRAAGSPEGTVRVTGTLALGSRRLQTGVDNVLSETVVVPDASAPPTEYTFHADGTLSVSAASGTPARGTWARNDDGSLRLSLLDGQGRLLTTVYEVERAGSGIVLTSRTPRDACDAACREDRILHAAGLPGTLLETWTESEIYLSAR